MKFILDEKTSESISKVYACRSEDFIEIVIQSGQDPKSFFEYGDWSGLDFRRCNITGVSFFGANLRGAIFTPSQANEIERTNKSISDIITKELKFWETDDAFVLAREYKRILRRLDEPNAILATSSEMEKAIVVRELPNGRNLRTAVLEAETVDEMHTQELIELVSEGKINRFIISEHGRQALKNGAEREMEDLKQSLGDIESRPISTESPLLTLALREDGNGHPFLDSNLVAAGERLHKDFELAQMEPSVNQNWNHFLSSGRVSEEFVPQKLDGARGRVADALIDMGPGIGDVLLRVCCFYEELEQAERRLGWAKRSAKIVLKIALQRLARYYLNLS